MENSCAADISNSWSVGGRTRHIDLCNYFLQELKDQELLVIKHIVGEKNDADIFTKNMTSAIFNKHVSLYVGTDEYVIARSSSGEAVGDWNSLKLEEGKYVMFSVMQDSSKINIPRQS